FPSQDLRGLHLHVLPEGEEPMLGPLILPLVERHDEPAVFFQNCFHLMIISIHLGSLSYGLMVPLYVQIDLPASPFGLGCSLLTTCACSGQIKSYGSCQLR